MIKDIYSYKSYIPRDAKDEGHVWCFQAVRLLSPAVALNMENAVHKFLNEWTYHGKPVLGFVRIFYGQFLVFYAEDVSGCGIDKLFAFVKQQSEYHQIALLNRTLQAFYIKGKIEVIPFTQIEHALKNNLLHPDTLHIDNSISTLKELKEKWIVPIKSSWMADAFLGIQ